VAGFDRRRLLTLSLLWYAVGHLAGALMPSFAALLPVRAARCWAQRCSRRRPPLPWA
jgi:predicted MFS family arabinose efflux permease